MVPERTPSEHSRIVSEFAHEPDFADLIELFVSELPERVAAIEDAFKDSNHTEVTRLTHQLKGASPGYGFPTIGRAAADVEDWYRSRDDDAQSEIEGVRSKIDELINLCARAAHVS